jgi:ABC-2 type transport system permease protein
MRALDRRRIRAVVRRHVYVLKRSPHRFFDLTVWPFLDVLLFGSLGVFVAQENAASKAGATYLLAGIVMFHILYQLQIALCTGFMEETWSRNLLNVMTTPVTEAEYVAGVGLFGLAKVAVALCALSLIAFAFFGFNLAGIGWALVPVAAVLLLCGYAIAMSVIGLMLRFGQSAEIFAWGFNFLVMGLSGVFNPVEAIPGPLQPVAKALPTTHAFAALRAVLEGHPLPWDDIAWGLIGGVVAALAGLAFATSMLKLFRKRGYVTRFS